MSGSTGCGLISGIAIVQAFHASALSGWVTLAICVVVSVAVIVKDVLREDGR